MKLQQVIKKTKLRINEHFKNHAQYQKHIGIDKTSLSLFVNGHLSYVPPAILRDLDLKAVTETNYYRDKVEL